MQEMLEKENLTCCGCPIEAVLYKLDKLFIPLTAMAAELWFQFQGEGGGAKRDCWWAREAAWRWAPVNPLSFGHW